MPTYEFSFPGSAAGLPVSITQGGVQVDTATAGSPTSPWGPVVVAADLPEGSYVAEAYNTSTFYSSRATGVVNVTASFASASVVGTGNQARIELAQTGVL